MNPTIAVLSVLSIVIAFCSLFLAYRSVTTGAKSISTLNNVRNAIQSEFERIKDTNKDTQELISRIASLFDASEKAGLEMVYPDRKEALSQFTEFLKQEKSEVAIVGSSLLGLSLFVTGFEDIVHEEPEKFRFILTHPEVSQLREGPEGRDPGVIKGEILEAIHKLKKWGVPLENIQLYKGSPSVFMITSSEHMLLNPYPSGTEAYRCFCIQVSARGSIYAQYYDKHFTKIWNSKWVEKCGEFLERTGAAGHSDPIAPAEL